MLARMPPALFHEWRAFEALEPFGEERSDFRSAQVVQALWNIARDRNANPKGWPITDFMLAFGDSPWASAKAAPQTVAYQELLIDSWVAGSNAAFAAAKKD